LLSVCVAFVFNLSAACFSLALSFSFSLYAQIDYALVEAPPEPSPRNNPTAGLATSAYSNEPVAVDLRVPAVKVELSVTGYVAHGLENEPDFSGRFNMTRLGAAQFE
jgi:hypothetical protein